MQYELINSCATNTSEKMSQERLRLKLITAGWDEKVVIALDREKLIARYVELLANPQPVAAVAIDPELEK